MQNTTYSSNIKCLEKIKLMTANLFKTRILMYHFLPSTLKIMPIYSITNKFYNTVNFNPIFKL